MMNLTTQNSFTPQTLDEALRFADLLSKSSLVPKDYQNHPGNILVAMQWGAEIGLQPLQAMQNICVVNGRPAIWGDAMLALVQGSGLLESFNETITADSATCTLQRKGMAVETVRTFTLEDAKRAGLTGKQGPWTQYPKRMMQMRARAWALRDTFADVLKGLKSAEEVQDMPPVERDITPDSAPVSSRPRSRAEQIRAQLKPAPVVVEQVSLSQVLEAISTAQTLDALKAAAELAKTHLVNGQLEEARAAYKVRFTELQPPTTETGEVTYQMVAELISKGDLDTAQDLARHLSADDRADIEALLAQREAA